MKPRWGTIFAALLMTAGLVAVGCATLSKPGPELVAATTADVQAQAWGQVKDLQATLARLDPDRHPGVAALGQDLAAVVEKVEASAGPHYDKIDLPILIEQNPHYWRAMLELAPADPTLLVLEGMLLAASGKVEAASDLLELVRAGPLMEEALDEKLVLQRRTISRWRWSPPGVDLAMAAGLPPVERWQPVKQAQQQYPDSPAAALAVLRMRADLAGIDLTPASEDQRMRDKILEAEPGAVETLQTQQPLRAALVTATGDSADAARRVSEMLAPDATGILNFSEDDFAKLVADVSRLGLPDWTLRVSRLQMAQRGEVQAADIEVWRQVLPAVIGEAAAAELLADWSNDRLPETQIFKTTAHPAGTAERPMDPLVGGHYERSYRDARIVLEKALPSDEEKAGALLRLAESARTLGRFAEAEEALNRYAAITEDARTLAGQRLALAVSRSDVAAAEIALREVEQRDRKLTAASFSAGNARILTGDAAAAAAAFRQGFENERADPTRRGFAALHAFGAAQLAGEDGTKWVREALSIVPEDAWITDLLRAVVGERDREQLLAAAEEGRSYLTTGQRCEAYFALAFAPGQTSTGRRADLQACVDTGMVGYIEYEFARNWLRHDARSALR